MAGKVFIVGAGPGDPELLTLKAQRLIMEADAVVHDRLIAPAILAMIPETAEKFFVGKSCKNHVMKQDEINDLLVALAKRCLQVVRLKGGDPMIFGRGGEEAEYLVRQSVAFEVIPGVSSATGCSAFNGIPLTYRGLSNGVHYVTGHSSESGQELVLDWHRLADPDTTLVVYMGLANTAVIARKLMEYGLPADFPFAAIQDGTTENNRIVISTLANAADDVTAAKLESPVLIIIGRVVKLHKLLS